MSYLQVLHKQILNHFSLSDLKLLCFDVGIEFDDLSGDTRPIKALSLLKEVAQKGRLPDLLTEVQAVRPLVDWKPIPHDFDPNRDQFLLDNSAETTITATTGSGAIAIGEGNVALGAGAVYVPGTVHGDIITGGVTKIYRQATNLNVDERRVRDVLLSKVIKFWIEGVLEKSLYQLARIELGLKYTHDSVHRPWMLNIAQPGFESQAVSQGISALTLVEQMGGSMLILGAPGSGKTTTLLEIAQGLAVKAQEDASLQIPVVLNLSSWSQTRESLTKWIIEELFQTYQVNRKFSTEWIKKEPFILLLDGLDEVDERHRAGCVEAINRFRSDNGLTQVIICSRIADYQSLPLKLAINGAVEIQPLTSMQVRAYIDSAGEKLAAVREALQMDIALWDLAQSPLMLSMLSIAYWEMDLEALHVDEQYDRRQHLFSTYVRRMFKRRKESLVSIEQAQLCLNWLASQMSNHSTVPYYLEKMQPDWIPEQTQRNLYRILVVFIVVVSGLIIGAAYGGVVSLLVEDAWLLGVLGGILSGTIIGIWLSGQSIQPVERLRLYRPERKDVFSNILKGGFFGILSGGVGGLLFNLEDYYSGVSNLTPIIIETLALAILGILLGASVGAMMAMLRPEEINHKQTPNQGILHSGRIFFFVSLIATLLLGAGAVLIGEALFAVFISLIYLVLAIRFGGGAFLQHYALRVTLAYYGYCPFKLTVFLDEMSQHILMHKVGGGYIFIHNFLQDYFRENQSAIDF